MSWHPLAIEAIKNITVVGAGTMGHGIAQVFAMNGFSVNLVEPDDARREAAIGKIDANLKKGVAKGKVSENTRTDALSNLQGHASLDAACQGAHLVIEAVPEDAALKKKIFTAAESVCAEGCVFATNTSSLSVGGLAAELSQPARLIGMHFFNPVHIMRLLEIVTHASIHPDLPQMARTLGERIGKTPITVRDAPGFASSRLGIAIGLEAMRMVEENVASAADIDTAMRLGYGFPMGPLELTDLVGLDVRLDIALYLQQELGERFAPPQVLRDKVAAGELGKKSGAGFYRWVDGQKVAD